jgi:hypothetical protein
VIDHSMIVAMTKQTRVWLPVYPTIFHRNRRPIGEFRVAWDKPTKAAGDGATGRRTCSVFDRYVELHSD